MPIVYNKMPALAAGARPVVDRVLAKTAFDIEVLAKVKAPVDTGNLMNSIAADKVADLRWRVTANAEYAVYVELGTRHMDPQAYLEPAMNEVWPHAVAAMRTVIP